MVGTYGNVCYLLHVLSGRVMSRIHVADACKGGAYVHTASNTMSLYVLSVSERARERENERERKKEIKRERSSPAIPLFSRLQYGVATTSRFLKIIGLFCRISSLL